MTAQEIISKCKTPNFTGLRIDATKKIEGHSSVFIAIPQHYIYDAWVWGSGKKDPIERINLRAAGADEKLSLYV